MRRLCSPRTSRQRASPIASRVAVEFTMSVNSTVARSRSLPPSMPIPTTFALVHSSVTNGSSPTTLASCPDGIS